MSEFYKGLVLAAGLGAMLGLVIAAGVTGGEVFIDLADAETFSEGLRELLGSATICSAIGAVLWSG